MKLYFKPGACSMASHITLQEIGAPFETEAVDTAVGTTASGADYRQINAKGYVPTLQLDDGEFLTEGPAILQYLADSAPETGLAPATGTLDRARTMEQLNFVATELHKAFSPLFRENSSDASKAQAKKNVRARFDTVEALLADGRDTLVPGQFTIADAYLFVVASWANFTGIPLPEWPNLARFMERTAARPSVHRAMQAEGLVQ